MNSCEIVVPGRVNLIGEHIDYHNLPVLPMAIPRHITLHLMASSDHSICLNSATYGCREIRLSETPSLGEAGDWGNYLKAAVKAVQTRWSVQKGFRGNITSNLPAAAGLSSSSALITAVTLGLLRVNGIEASLDQLMAILPEGEHFVGTRGGGMDHAAVLASRKGCASLIRFAPFGIENVKVPDDWRFLIAHSLVRAEKSGATRERYNFVRTMGVRALSASGDMPFTEYKFFQHIKTEEERVAQAVDALRRNDRRYFGRLLNDSHASLRDRLEVSCPALDSIVKIAQNAGADGARLTGAGFGGCAIILCNDDTQDKIIAALEKDFYTAHDGYTRDEHLLKVLPSNGALNAH